MSHIYPHQSNTQPGRIVRTANADLAGLEPRLVRLVSNAGAAEVALPTAATQHTPFLLNEGADTGGPCNIEPLEPGKQYRVPLVGTCAPGDELVMANPSTTADRGKVRKLPSASGTYILVGHAEESGVDGQHVLFRPTRLGQTVTV